MDAPACTFQQSGRSRVRQRWYHCKTCKLTGDKGCCEACAKSCHVGHSLKFVEESPFYCDCGSQGMCGQCTFQVTGSTPAKQPSLLCESCSTACCSVCATNCHAGHVVKPSTSSAPSVCECGRSELCARLKGVRECTSCTYLTTGERYTVQDWFNCLTCGLNGTSGVCKVCARLHHVGHNLVARTPSEYYCDCGSSGLCGLLENVQRCTSCTFLVTGRTQVVQEWFNCMTCKLMGESGVCRFCANSHHVGHTLIARPAPSNFFCDCGAKGLCGKLAVVEAARQARAQARLASEAEEAALALARTPVRKITRSTAHSSTLVALPSGFAAGGASAGAGASPKPSPTKGRGASASSPSAAAAAAAAAAAVGAGAGSRAADPSDEQLCVVCFDKQRNTLLSHGQAGHLCVCYPCAKLLLSKHLPCPVCRQAIITVTQVFM